MYEELKGVDLEALERQTRAFLDATESAVPRAVEPQLLEPRPASASMR